MELIHIHAEQWHCDTGRVAVMGFSAGGHLAAHYSTCHDWPEVREVFPDSNVLPGDLCGSCTSRPTAPGAVGCPRRRLARRCEKVAAHYAARKENRIMTPYIGFPYRCSQYEWHRGVLLLKNAPVPLSGLDHINILKDLEKHSASWGRKAFLFMRHRNRTG